VEKIVFFHMNQLGDMLFSLPVLEALRRQKPEAMLYSVINSNLAPLLKASGLVDGIIEKDAYAKFKLSSIIKKENFTKAVLFSESPSSLLSAFFAKIPIRVGFDSASLSFLLTQKAEKKGVPSLANNARLAKVCGIKDIKPTYEGLIKVSDSASLKIQNWFKENNLDPAKTVAFSVGASHRRRQKCLDNKVWAEVLGALGESLKLPVLVGAAWEEESLTQIAAMCKKKPRVFISENILESAAFYSKAALFCGTDSGAMHLAAAVGTKCIAVFGPTDPEQVGPMPAHKHVIIKQKNINKVLAKDIILAVLDSV